MRGLKPLIEEWLRSTSSKGWSPGSGERARLTAKQLRKNLQDDGLVDRRGKAREGATVRGYPFRFGPRSSGKDRERAMAFFAEGIDKIRSMGENRSETNEIKTQISYEEEFAHIATRRPRRSPIARCDDGRDQPAPGTARSTTKLHRRKQVVTMAHGFALKPLIGLVSPEVSRYLVKWIRAGPTHTQVTCIRSEHRPWVRVTPRTRKFRGTTRSSR